MKPNDIVTQSEVEALIAATWSDNPPNPYEPPSEVWERMHHFCWGAGYLGADEIKDWLKLPEPDYEWTSERADLLYGEVSDERYNELNNGASLTSEEQELFRQRAEESIDLAWGANIFRLRAPENSAERRVVYFAYTYACTSMSRDIEEQVGPLRTMREALKFIENNAFDVDETEYEDES